MRFQQEKAPRTGLPSSVMNDHAIMWKNTIVVIWEFALNANCSYSWKGSGGLLLDKSCVLSVSCGQKEKRRGATLKVLSCLTDGCQGFEQDQLWSLGTKAACSVAQSTHRKRLREQKYLWLCGASKKLGATLPSQSYVMYLSENLWCSHGRQYCSKTNPCFPEDEARRLLWSQTFHIFYPVQIRSKFQSELQFVTGYFQTMEFQWQVMRTPLF